MDQDHLGIPSRLDSEAVAKGEVRVLHARGAGSIHDGVAWDVVQRGHQTGPLETHWHAMHADRDGSSLWEGNRLQAFGRDHLCFRDDESSLPIADLEEAWSEHAGRERIQTSVPYGCALAMGAHPRALGERLIAAEMTRDTEQPWSG